MKGTRNSRSSIAWIIPAGDSVSKFTNSSGSDDVVASNHEESSYVSHTWTMDSFEEERLERSE